MPRDERQTAAREFDHQRKPSESLIADLAGSPISLLEAWSVWDAAGPPYVLPEDKPLTSACNTALEVSVIEHEVVLSERVFNLPARPLMHEGLDPIAVRGGD